MPADLSARDLVNKVWDEVAAGRALHLPPTADLGDYDRLVEDGERHYVNSRYVLDRTPFGGKDAGPGRVKGKLRRRAAHFVVGSLGSYFDDEQEFLAHLVRLQNTITRHIDRLSEEVRRLETMLQAEAVALRTADTTLHTRLENRIQALEGEIARLRESGNSER